MAWLSKALSRSFSTSFVVDRVNPVGVERSQSNCFGRMIAWRPSMLRSKRKDWSVDVVVFFRSYLPSLCRKASIVDGSRIELNLAHSP